MSIESYNNPLNNNVPEHYFTTAEWKNEKNEAGIEGFTRRVAYLDDERVAHEVKIFIPSSGAKELTKEMQDTMIKLLIVAKEAGLGQEAGPEKITQKGEEFHGTWGGSEKTVKEKWIQDKSVLNERRVLLQGQNTKSEKISNELNSIEQNLSSIDKKMNLLERIGTQFDSAIPRTPRMSNADNMVEKPQPQRVEIKAEETYESDVQGFQGIKEKYTERKKFWMEQYEKNSSPNVLMSGFRELGTLRNQLLESSKNVTQGAGAEVQQDVQSQLNEIDNTLKYVLDKILDPVKSQLEILKKFENSDFKDTALLRDYRNAILDLRKAVEAQPSLRLQEFMMNTLTSRGELLPSALGKAQGALVNKYATNANREEANSIKMGVAVGGNYCKETLANFNARNDLASGEEALAALRSQQSLLDRLPDATEAEKKEVNDNIAALEPKIKQLTQERFYVIYKNAKQAIDEFNATTKALTGIRVSGETGNDYNELISLAVNRLTICKQMAEQLGILDRNPTISNNLEKMTFLSSLRMESGGVTKHVQNKMNEFASQIGRMMTQAKNFEANRTLELATVINQQGETLIAGLDINKLPREMVNSILQGNEQLRDIMRITEQARKFVLENKKS